MKNWGSVSFREASKKDFFFPYNKDEFSLPYYLVALRVECTFVISIKQSY